MIKGIMKCIRDFESDHFHITIVLCGKLLWGDLGLVVWKEKVPNLFGTSKCILCFYNLGFHWIPLGEYGLLL
jgi:hypothetical protein